MENTIEMNQRTGGGKGEARKLRATNEIPGICYGNHMETPVPVSVNKIKIAKLLRGSNPNKIYNVDSKDAAMKGQMVLIQDKQIHPLTEEIVHIDFLAVNKDEEIRVTVPVSLQGKAKGVVEGGILQQPNRTVDVRCLPHLIPEKIIVDVTNVNINDALHASDVTFPEGVKLVGSMQRTLAVVVPPDEDKTPKAAVDAAAPAAAAPAAAAAKAPAKDKK